MNYIGEAFSFIVRHSKNITYFLLGLAIVWAVPYCIVKQKDFPTGVITVIGMVYGIGAAGRGYQAHAAAKVEIAKASA